MWIIKKTPKVELFELIILIYALFKFQFIGYSICGHTKAANNIKPFL